MIQNHVLIWAIKIADTIQFSLLRFHILYLNKIVDKKEIDLQILLFLNTQIVTSGFYFSG